MIAALKRFFQVLSLKERKRFWHLQILVVIQGLAEVAATLAILPFLRLAVDPLIVEKNSAYRWAKEMAGVESVHTWTILAGAAVLVLIIGSNSLAAILTRSRMRYIYGLLSSVSIRLLESYLARDYAF